MTMVNVAIEMIGVLLIALIFSACCAERNKDSQMKFFLVLLVLNAITLLADSTSWLFDGKKDLNGLLYVSTTVTYGLSYIMEGVFTCYILAIINKRKKVSYRLANIVLGFCLLEVFLLISFTFGGLYYYYENGVYYRGKLFILSQMLPLIVLIIDMGIVLFYRKFFTKKEIMVLMFYGGLPILSTLLKLAIADITITYVSVALGLLIIYLGVYAEQNKRLHEREKELSEMRVSIMLSQIQPHFLYNALSTIQALCTKNPEKARDALGDFSKFMRGNMDSLSSQKPIHFSRELEHVKHYLNLEKVRFGDKLEIRYEIEEDDFFLPALTLQPIVENAVKYGIGNVDNGGKVTIRTKADGKNIVVNIVDNGIGFHADSVSDIPVKNDGRSHIGLNNVRSRIQKMVGGDLSLHSRENMGTIVTITIPKEQRV